MWPNIRELRVFLFITIVFSAIVIKINSGESTSHGTIKTNNTEAMDVILNITKVNKLLEDLIKNYKQLQKLSKSHESFESDYSGDSEKEEIIFNGSSKKRKRAREESTKKPVDERYAITEMIVSEGEGSTEEETNTQEESANQDDIKDNKKLLLKTSHDENQDKNRNVDIFKSEEGASSNSDSYEYDTNLNNSEVQNKVNKTKAKLDRVYDKSGLAKSKAKFDKVSKNLVKKIRILSDQVMKDKEKFHPRSGTVYSRNGNDDIPIKKIVRAEIFAPEKIWTEIINNKPIELKPEKEIIIGETSLPLDSKINKFARSRTSSKKLLEPSRIEYSQVSSNSSESDEPYALKKEQMKTNILRNAYGSACSKLVVKKCYRACKATIKVVCVKYPCKKTFRETFKEESKTCCINQLGSEVMKKKLKANSKKEKIIIANEDEEREDTRASKKKVLKNNKTKHGFVDMTREGYWKACFPEFMYKSQNNSSLRNLTKAIKTSVPQLNILRDRYERACQRASANLCKRACTDAYEQTAAAEKSTKEKGKMTKKECKRQCWMAYDLSTGSSSDSDYDSDSYDDSDDDDDDDD